jgi:hypothetical protein
MSYVDVLVMFNDLKRSRDIIVCFIDIGDIVDHNCLSFLFIIYKNYMYTEMKERMG